MKCDQCENEATVHEVMIKGGKKHERHLCEQCARKHGVNVAPAAPPITQLLTQFIAQTAAAAGAGASAGAGGAAAGKGASGKPLTACPACGLAFSSFRNSGLLGCPECYRAFEGQLAPMLARAHEGGTHHVGKKPARAAEEGATKAGPAKAASTPGAKKPATGHVVKAATGAGGPTSGAPASDRSASIAAAKKKLAEAIASEQYEVAAKLRDELARLEGRAIGPKAGGAGAAEPGKGGDS